MADITMNLNDTLELDAIIQEWNDPSNIVEDSNNKFNLSGIQTSTRILDPKESGTHTIKVNGQELSVEVTDPSTIPDSGLLHHYDATEVSGSDGDQILQWEDLEGNNDLEGGGSPKINTDGINGVQTIDFNDSNDYMRFSNSESISQPHDVYIVYKFDSTGQYPRIFDGQFADHALYNSNSTLIMRAGDTTMDATIADTNPHIATTRWDGANSVLRQDGVDEASDADVGSNALDGFKLAERYNQSTNSDVRIGEVLIYDTVLSDTKRNSLESYLSDKWGIAI